LKCDRAVIQRGFPPSHKQAHHTHAHTHTHTHTDTHTQSWGMGGHRSNAKRAWVSLFNKRKREQRVPREKKGRDSVVANRCAGAIGGGDLMMMIHVFLCRLSLFSFHRQRVSPKNCSVCSKLLHSKLQKANQKKNPLPVHKQKSFSAPPSPLLHPFCCCRSTDFVEFTRDSQVGVPFHAHHRSYLRRYHHRPSCLAQGACRRPFVPGTAR
jgi:hypothetical protein